MLLGIDVGTTHLKAGLFTADGRLQALAARDTPTAQAPAGESYHDPQSVWQAAVEAVAEAVAAAGPGTSIESIGITGMAEAGLLVDAASGALRSIMVPWFDRAPAPQAERLARLRSREAAFFSTGVKPTFKLSVAKILWLREARGVCTARAVWLSAPSYIAWRMCGIAAFDPSQATRTGAFDLVARQWDLEWLGGLDLQEGLFPPVHPSGAPLGGLLAEPAAQMGLLPGVPVCIAGHDHPCASYAALLLSRNARLQASGNFDPSAGDSVGQSAGSAGEIFDSMGTAEGILGSFPARPLEQADFASGLSFGCHVRPGWMYWMGGLNTSGGALEWLRRLLGDPPLSYAALQELAETAGDGPGEVLFMPYLAGKGSPHSSPQSHAALVGLALAHGRAELVRAVLEGTAYEVELIRRAALTSHACDEGGETLVSGGSSRFARWMQIKADVSGCAQRALVMPEVSLLGAALLAGVGCGVYPSELEAARALAPVETRIYRPDPERHDRYTRFFEQRFLGLQNLP